MKTIFGILTFIGLMAVWLFSIRVPLHFVVPLALAVCAVIFCWKNGRAVMRIGCGACAILLLLLLASPANAQVSSTKTNSLDGIPAVITGGGVSNVTSTAIDVYQGRGMSVFPYFAGNAASAVGNLTLDFAVSGDGTNFSTTNYLTMSVPGNGASGVRGWTNFPATQLSNVRKIKLVRISNANSAGTNYVVTNIITSVGY